MKPSDLAAAIVAVCSLGTALVQYAERVAAQNETVEVARTLGQAGQASAEAARGCE